MSRLAVLFIAVVAISTIIFSFWSRVTHTANSERKFNVVLISIDSLRPDRMGVYGYSRDTTPHMDAFAENSIVFDNYFAAAYLTPISEMSVHTGRYPFNHGVVNFETVLKDDVKTLAQVLRASGWQTAAFGSSQEFYRPIALRKSFSKGFDTYDISSGDPALPWFGRGELRVSEAIEWMRVAQEKDAPFFLWLNVGSVHWPYGEDEPPHFTDPSYDGDLVPPKYADGPQPLTMFNNLYGRFYKGKQYDADKRVISNDISTDMRYVQDRYDDGLLMTDRKLGEILDFLDRPGIKENTIVIIQSEHGEDLGEHEYIAHYDIFDTTTHVPLIVKIPGVEPRRVSGLISGVDIFPTVLDALNIDHGSVDGISHYAHIRDTATGTVRDELYLTRTPLWERVISAYVPWLREFVVQDDREHFRDTAIRTREWKLIHRQSRDILAKYSWWGNLTGVSMRLPEYELYNLTTDPKENVNVYAQHAAVADELKKKLAAWERGGDVPPVPSGRVEQIQPYF